MVGDVVEQVAGPAAVDQASAFPGGALKDRGAAGAGAGEDHVPDVQAGGAAVVDLRERAVGQITPLSACRSRSERAGHVQDVPREGHAGLWARGKLFLIITHRVLYS